MIAKLSVTTTITATITTTGTIAVTGTVTVTVYSVKLNDNKKS